MPTNNPQATAAKPHSQSALNYSVDVEAQHLSSIALRSISQGVIITGPDQLIISANAAFTAITGFSESEILGKNCKFLVGRDTDPLTVAAIRLAIKNCTEYAGVILNYRKDGTPFWNDLTISPVRDAAGKLTNFIGVTRDVTESKEVAKKLSESEMRMRLAIRGGDLGLWDWQVSSGQLTVNDHWLTMLGLDPQTHKPSIENWHSLVHPEDMPKLERLFKEVILNPAGCELEVEIRARHKNGSYIWILDKGRVADRAPNGSPLRVVGTHLDITKRKMAEAALEQNQKLLLSITENTSDAIYVKDTQGRYLLFNAAASRYVGKPAEAVLGKDDTALFPPDQARELMAGDRQVMASAHVQTYEEADLTTNLGPTTFLATKGPIHNAQGEVSGIFGIARDITKRKQAEIELRASEARFRTLVEHSPNCIHEIDLAGRLTSMNRAGLKMLGVDDFSSIQGTPYLDAVGDSDRERIAGLLTDAFAGQASEFIFQTPHGLIFQSSFVPIANEEGAVQNLMGVTIDITARKHAEMVDGFLAQAGVSTQDEAFFPSLARFLATSMQMDYVCIDQFDEDGLNAMTLTVWHDNQFRDNVTYALSETPCGVVVKKGRSFYPCNVQQHFPKDLMLQEMQAESYAGVSLVSHTGKPIGLIAALGRKPLANRALAEAALARVATRAAGELERLQAENQIAKTTEILERTGELANIGGWSVNLKTMKLSWTRETFRIAEIEPPVEPCLEEGINLFAPEARPTIAAAVQAAIDSGTPYDLELPIITARGRQRWVHTQGFAEFQGSKPVRIYGTFQDITARKQTEQLLLANEAKFRAIIDQSPVPMAINDEWQRITFLNPAFIKTFGYDLDDIPTLAAWWPKAYPDPEYRQWVIDSWQAELVRAAKTGTEFTPYELKIHCKDGNDRFVLASAAPLTACLEETQLVLLYDISERKRAEQNLKLAHETSNRAKNEFLANMSHEIRTPLTAILGFADILGEDEAVHQSPEWRKQIVDTIKNAGAHLLAVINDILDLSKIEADKLTVEKTDTPLVELLGEVERLMHHTAAGKGLVLSMAISSHLPERILCDATRLRQILMNLVGNAIKFTAEGSVRITAGVEHQDRQARLVIDIADTGPGMSPEQVLGLFKPFGQADSTVTRRHGGTGLGLVISRRLAQILGGDVTLLNTEIGKGSCFRFVLPFEEVVDSTTITSLSPSLAKVEPQPSAVATKLHGRVLLAEDGLDNQRLIAFIMRNAGVTIETAANGRIALDMLDQAAARGAPFDLLLSDMQMPEMDGYNLATTLRGRGYKIPIIALTAHAMADDRKKCIDAGCDDYIAKPVNNVHLIAKCAEWMSKNSGAK